MLHHLVIQSYYQVCRWVEEGSKYLEDKVALEVVVLEAAGEAAVVVVGAVAQESESAAQA
jgi:hypothetical protein